VLADEPEDHVLAATVWTFGQIWKRTPQLAKILGIGNILCRSLQVCYNDCPTLTISE
jgi:hypothetical protein